MFQGGRSAEKKSAIRYARCRYGVDVIAPDRLPDMVIASNPCIALCRLPRRFDRSFATQFLSGVKAILFDPLWACPMSAHTMFDISLSHP